MHSGFTAQSLSDMQVAAQSVGGGGGDGSDTTATPCVTQAPRKMASENFMGTRVSIGEREG